MIPYKSEPIADLRARFPKALEPVVDTTGPLITYVPGERAEHIFDGVDGIRVIASRDKTRTKNGGTAIFYHLSASAWYGTVLAAKVQSGRINGERFKHMCELRFQELTGLKIRKADHFTITNNKCFHWFWREVYTGTSEDTEKNLV